jgi:hypothetical protein
VHIRWSLLIEIDYLVMLVVNGKIRIVGENAVFNDQYLFNYYLGIT